MVFLLNCVKEGNFVAFQTLSEFLEEKKFVVCAQVKAVIIAHLDQSRAMFLKYFPEIENGDSSSEWITQPFSDEAITDSALPINVKEKLCELSANISLKLRFEELEICEFWHVARIKFRDPSDIAITALLPFSVTSLCDQGFLALTTIKACNRSGLTPTHALILAHSSTRPPPLPSKEKSTFYINVFFISI